MRVYLLIFLSLFKVLSASAGDSSEDEIMLPVETSPSTVGSKRSPPQISGGGSSSGLVSSLAASATSSSQLGLADADKEGLSQSKRRKVTKKPVSASAHSSSKGEAKAGISAPEVASKEELISLIGGKNGVKFQNRLDSIGPEAMSPEMSHELVLTCIDNLKATCAKYMLSKGYRLILNPPSEKVVDVVHRTIEENKLEFLLTTLLDLDPAGTIKLINLILVKYNFIFSTILEKFKKALQKADTSIDPEAIQLAAETAAELKAIRIFIVIFESGLMVRMIPSGKLLTLLSDPRTEKTDVFYPRILFYIINDRKVATPFDLNILSFAALEGNYDFLDVVEPFLGQFSWDIIIQAITFALKRGHLSFAEILLRTSNYSSCDLVFRLVSQEVFVTTVASHANAEVMARLVNAVINEGRTMLVVDLNLMKIYMRAAKVGNIEVVEFLLRGEYFTLNARFNGKSIFRIALENGQFNLARYMIKTLRYNIFDTYTPTINPGNLGGDSLIYVANDSNIDMFSYLLRLGANPNARVLDDSGKLTSLLLWCVEKDQVLLVKQLIEHGAKFDLNEADTMVAALEKKQG